MRNIIVKFLINILLKLMNNREPSQQYKINMRMCRLVRDDRFVLLAMPNGEILPCQRNIVIKQPYNSSKIVEVECTVFVYLDDISL